MLFPLLSRSVLLTSLSIAITALSIGAYADDWPQWMGTNRDAKVQGFVAPKNWPKELKKQLNVEGIFANHLYL